MTNKAVSRGNAEILQPLINAIEKQCLPRLIASSSRSSCNFMDRLSFVSFVPTCTIMVWTEGRRSRPGSMFSTMSKVLAPE